jgi:putative membrane protein, TIGR04086 family
MKLLKQKAISFLISLLILTIIVAIYTSLLYNGKISSDTKAIYRSTFIIGAVYFFIVGLLSGIIEQKKGFLSSFISGIILIIIIIVVRLLSKRVILLNDWVKYVIYLGMCIIGGIIGVNLTFKRKEKKRS